MDSEIKKIVDAYQNQEISLGKLAKELNMDPITARDFLQSNGIRIYTVETEDIPSDTNNA